MRREIETNGTAGGRDSLVLPMTLLRSVVVLAFAAIAVGFWLLQIAQYEKYRRLAENNHQRTIAPSMPVFPPSASRTSQILRSSTTPPGPPDDLIRSRRKAYLTISPRFTLPGR